MAVKQYFGVEEPYDGNRKRDLIQNNVIILVWHIEQEPNSAEHHPNISAKCDESAKDCSREEIPSHLDVKL